MTKLSFLVAAALLAATATTAAAQAVVQTQPSASLSRYVADLEFRGDNSVRLGRIVADAAGVVEIYDYADSTQGRLLASEPFSAGSNLNVRVPLDTPRYNAALAVLKIDGQTVHQEVIRWNPDFN